MEHLTSIICAALTLIGVIITAFVSYRANKRSKVFEAFFTNKAKAYAEFWECFAAARRDNSDPCLRAELQSKCMMLSVFSEEKTSEQAHDLAALVLQHGRGNSISQELDQQTQELVKSLRKELRECRKNQS